MLKESKAFCSFSVSNQSKAQDFYSNTLGLDVEKIDDNLLVIKLKGGFKVMMYSKPDHVAATFTVLNFPVDNIKETVDDLTMKNVNFEIYNNEYIQTNAKGIFDDPAMKMSIAWFKDPCGNIISLIEDHK